MCWCELTNVRPSCSPIRFSRPWFRPDWLDVPAGMWGERCEEHVRMYGLRDQFELDASRERQIQGVNDPTTGAAGNKHDMTVRHQSADDDCRIHTIQVAVVSGDNTQDRYIWMSRENKLERINTRVCNCRVNVNLPEHRNQGIGDNFFVMCNDNV